MPGAISRMAGSDQCHLVGIRQFRSERVRCYMLQAARGGRRRLRYPLLNVTQGLELSVVEGGLPLLESGRGRLLEVPMQQTLRLTHTCRVDQRGNASIDSVFTLQLCRPFRGWFVGVKIQSALLDESSCNIRLEAPVLRGACAGHKPRVWDLTPTARITGHDRDDARARIKH